MALDVSTKVRPVVLPLTSRLLSFGRGLPARPVSCASFSFDWMAGDVTPGIHDGFCRVRDPLFHWPPSSFERGATRHRPGPPDSIGSSATSTWKPVTRLRGFERHKKWIGFATLKSSVSRDRINERTWELSAAHEAELRRGQREHDIIKTRAHERLRSRANEREFEK